MSKSPAVANTDDGIGIRLARGVVAGVIAGAVASFAMDRFQAALSALSQSDDDPSEPATEKAANAIARQIAGHDIDGANRPLAGQAIHYALGIGLGAVYGIAAEFRPAVVSGYGTVFGLGTASVLDEGAVPAVGLGEAPWKSGAATHIYAYASHLAFGVTTELVRRQVAGTLRKSLPEG